MHRAAFVLLLAGFLAAAFQASYAQGGGGSGGGGGAVVVLPAAQASRAAPRRAPRPGVLRPSEHRMPALRVLAARA